MYRKQQIAVLGLGRFGRAVALELRRLGHDVLAVDSDSEIVQDMVTEVTHAVCADITDEAALRELGVSELDLIIVAISSNLEASIVATALVEQLGARRIIAKASNDLHASILHRVGATRVVYPERETGFRVAHSFAAVGIEAYLDFAPGYGVARVRASDSWIGRSLDDLDLESTCGLSVLLLSRSGEVIVTPDRELVLSAGDELLLAGLDEDLERMPADGAAG